MHAALTTCGNITEFFSSHMTVGKTPPLQRKSIDVHTYLLFVPYYTDVLCHTVQPKSECSAKGDGTRMTPTLLVFWTLSGK